MPTYSYQCEVCRKEFDAVRPIMERNDVSCCQQQARRKFVPPQVGGFKPRWLDLEGPGNPKGRVFVTSRGQLEDECRKRGKIHTGYQYFDKE